MVLGGLLTAITIYVLSVLGFTHLVETGTLIRIQHTELCPRVAEKPPPLLAVLMDVPGSRFHTTFYFHLTSGFLTFFFMIGSEIIARFSRRSQPIPVNATTTNINTIPFSTLNISISLAIFVNVILNIFGLSVANGIQLSVVLAALLVTNKKARKHLRTRLRQNLDSLTVGRSSRVVSIALVPIRDF